MIQVGEHLPSQGKALSSVPNTAKTYKNKLDLKNRTNKNPPTWSSVITWIIPLMLRLRIFMKASSFYKTVPIQRSYFTTKKTHRT
jgi:hypothetical protein